MYEIKLEMALHYWKPKFNLLDHTPARLARSIEALHLDPKHAGENDHATLLLASARIEDHFPAPLPERCIHVIAHQPTSYVWQCCNR